MPPHGRVRRLEPLPLSQRRCLSSVERERVGAVVGLVVGLQYRTGLSELSGWRDVPISLLRPITLLGYGRTNRTPNRSVLTGARSGERCLASAHPKRDTRYAEAEDHHPPRGGFWDSTDFLNRYREILEVSLC